MPEIPIPVQFSIEHFNKIQNKIQIQNKIKIQNKMQNIHGDVVSTIDAIDAPIDAQSPPTVQIPRPYDFAPNSRITVVRENDKQLRYCCQGKYVLAIWWNKYIPVAVCRDEELIFIYPRNAHVESMRNVNWLADSDMSGLAKHKYGMCYDIRDIFMYVNSGEYE